MFSVSEVPQRTLINGCTYLHEKSSNIFFIPPLLKKQSFRGKKILETPRLALGR